MDWCDFEGDRLESMLCSVCFCLIGVTVLLNKTFVDQC